MPCCCESCFWLVPEEWQCPLPEDKENALKWRRSGVCWSVFGLLLALAGVIVPPVMDDLLFYGLRDAAVITSPTSTEYEIWLNNTKNPTLVTVYVYNVTNPNDILQGAKPILQEIGPFVYHNYQIKFNISWSDDLELINYSTWNYYVFNRSASIYDESFQFLGLNLPFAGLSANLANNPDNPQGPLQLFLCYDQYDEYDRLFATKSVSDVLFGYLDPVLEFLHELKPEVSPVFQGLLQNQTSAENVTTFDTAYTGKSMENFRQLYAYKGMHVYSACDSSTAVGSCGDNPDTSHPVWATRDASVVRGSLGTQTMPLVAPGSSFDVYRPDAFRPIKYYNRLPDGSVPRNNVQGIDTLRFYVEPAELLNQTANKANQVYYQNSAHGLLNVTSAAQHTQLFVSSPRLIGVGEPVKSGVLMSFDNSKPVGDLQNWFDVDPLSGASMSLNAATQLNIQINPIENMPADSGGTATWFANLTTTIVPVLWIRESASIDAEDAGRYTSQVYEAVRAMAFIEIIMVVFVFVGAAITLGGFSCYGIGETAILDIAEEEDLLGKEGTTSSSSVAPPSTTDSTNGPAYKPIQ